MKEATATVHELAVLYMETLKEMVSGRGNKVGYPPCESGALLGFVGGIRDLFNAGGASPTPPSPPGGPGSKVTVQCAKCDGSWDVPREPGNRDLVCPYCGKRHSKPIA